MLSKNILDDLNELSQIGFKSYGASSDGVDIKECECADKRLLVLGSEGDGLSKKVKAKIDNFVSIKMKREFDSLNVSVAGAILIDRIGDARRE